jgi:hypothetical protein
MGALVRLGLQRAVRGVEPVRVALARRLRRRRPSLRRVLDVRD